MGRTGPTLRPREVLTVFCWGRWWKANVFAHVRWVMGRPAVATLMGMIRVRGGGPLGPGLDRESLRQWMSLFRKPVSRAARLLHCRSGIRRANTRYGHQEEAVVGYNPHKRGRKSLSSADLRARRHADQRMMALAPALVRVVAHDGLFLMTVTRVHRRIPVGNEAIGSAA